VESDPAAKEALESKLKEFKLKKQLILDDPNEKPLTDEQKDAALRGLSGLIINASVIAAVALKKSPIPCKLSYSIIFHSDSYNHRFHVECY
jgi:hypothetical protein